MKIFVKTHTGKTVEVECNPDDTVLQLREKLALEGGSPETTILLYQGKALSSNEKTLSNCNIKDGSEIHMSHRSRINNGNNLYPTDFEKDIDVDIKGHVNNFFKRYKDPLLGGVITFLASTTIYFGTAFVYTEQMAQAMSFELQLATGFLAPLVLALIVSGALAHHASSNNISI